MGRSSQKNQDKIIYAMKNNNSGPKSQPKNLICLFIR